MGAAVGVDELWVKLRWGGWGFVGTYGGGRLGVGCRGLSLLWNGLLGGG